MDLLWPSRHSVGSEGTEGFKQPRVLLQLREDEKNREPGKQTHGVLGLPMPQGDVASEEV